MLPITHVNLRSLAPIQLQQKSPTWDTVKTKAIITAEHLYPGQISLVFQLSQGNALFGRKGKWGSRGKWFADTEVPAP